MIDFNYKILQCPVTKESLELVKDKATIQRYFTHINKQDIQLPELGFINTSQTIFYPVMKNIILLLPHYGWFLDEALAEKNKMTFDKERVFRYYNEIKYYKYEEKSIYEDSDKWVDYRPVSKGYLEASFSGARKYLNQGGEYYLDIASGPIGLKEYLSLSDGYNTRICIDISFNALLEAQRNFTSGKGLFICGDITNIPLKDNICDAVLSQHTLYHVPAGEQATAVEEMYRVTAPGGRIGIVYNWFFYSWMHNIFLFPVQLYRVLRHFAGKMYVRLFNKKPRLYYFVHPPGWFKRFSFYKTTKFYVWRSANKQFLSVWIHEWLGGKQLLNFIKKMETRHPEFMGKFGEYPIIVIDKTK